MKKLISILLVAMLIIGMFPATALTAFAADETATITFDDNAKRTEFDTNHQIWVENGITVTNNKASSTSNVADYAKPARFYKSSTLTVAHTGNITAIEFDCNSNTYATTMAKSATSEGSLSASSDKVTFKPTTPATSFTFTLSGGQVRMDGLTITYEAGGSSEPEEPVCEHENTENRNVVAPDCDTAGTHDVYCLDCDTTIEEGVVTPATGHNFVNGVCTVCQAEIEVKETETYTFSSYPAGTQYAENEEHVLSDLVTMYTTKAHFTSELRLYSSSTNNGYAIIHSLLPIKGISVNAGNKTDTLAVYGSNDGSVWTPITEISVTATSYKDYSSSFAPNAYNFLKLDVVGANQVRIKKMTLTFVTGEEEACTHELTELTPGTAATCTNPGKADLLSCVCGQNKSGGETLDALGHTYEDDACIRCYLINADTAKKATLMTDLPKAGDVVVLYNPASKVLLATAPNNDRMAGASAVAENGQVPYSSTAVAVMTVEIVDGNYVFVCNDKYLTSGETGNTLTFASDKTDLAQWTIEANEDDTGWYITNTAATFNGTDYNQAIEFHNNQFYPFGFNATYQDSFTMELYLVKSAAKPVAVVNGTEYTSIDEALEAIAANGGTLKLLANIEEAINVTGNLTLDLNGKTANVTATGTITAYDSTATASAAGIGVLTTSSDVKMDYTINGVRYIALNDGNNYTFHVLQMKLSAVTLRTNAAGIYYKATVICDPILAAAAESYGVALSTRNLPGGDFAQEKLYNGDVNGWTSIKNEGEAALTGKADAEPFTSGSVFNIFKGDANDTQRGEIKIYANAYLDLGNGRIVMASNDNWNEEAGTAWSLQNVIEALNNKTDLTDAQKGLIYNFYDTWKEEMNGWTVNNIQGWSQFA